MIIYFACSITGGRSDQSIYQVIVDALIEDGHEVPTALLATQQVLELEEIVCPDNVYQRDVYWIAGCDLLLAETSTPSHGVGYEIGYALSLPKPVLCIYRKGVKVSKMILGNRDPNLAVKTYENPPEAIKMIRSHIAYLARLQIP